MAVENLASDLDFPTNKELREVAIIRDVLKVFFQISTKLCAQKTVVDSEVAEVFKFNSIQKYCNQLQLQIFQVIYHTAK